MKGIFVGLWGGGLAFVLLGGGLWLLLVQAMNLGALGAGIAIVVGAASGIKWFFASAARYNAERQMNSAWRAAVEQRRQFVALDGPSAEGELLPITETLPTIRGEIKLLSNSIRFLSQDGHSLALPLMADAKWSVFEGHVLVELGAGVRLSGFGHWMLRIVDEDTDTWGIHLLDRNVPEEVPRSNSESG